MSSTTELSVAEVLSALVAGALLVGLVLPWLGLLAWAGRARARLAILPVASTATCPGASRVVPRVM